MMKIKHLLATLFVVNCLVNFGQHSPQDNQSSTDDEVTNSRIDIFAPNAFTPDGDMYNDSWKVFANGIDEYDFHLMIFDRTGQLVWESYDVSVGWDGTYAGNDVPAGLYVWMIDTKEIESDRKERFDGFINVLR